ncbi:MAG: hypothetical protein QXU88_02070 [Candidatus Woesearchaeota archaeon]
MKKALMIDYDAGWCNQLNAGLEGLGLSNRIKLLELTNPAYLSDMSGEEQSQRINNLPNNYVLDLKKVLEIFTPDIIILGEALGKEEKRFAAKRLRELSSPSFNLDVYICSCQKDCWSASELLKMRSDFLIDGFFYTPPRTPQEKKSNTKTLEQLFLQKNYPRQRKLIRSYLLVEPALRADLGVVVEEISPKEGLLLENFDVCKKLGFKCYSCLGSLEQRHACEGEALKVSIGNKLPSSASECFYFHKRCLNRLLNADKHFCTKDIYLF